MAFARLLIVALILGVIIAAPPAGFKEVIIEMKSKSGIHRLSFGNVVFRTASYNSKKKTFKTKLFTPNEVYEDPKRRSMQEGGYLYILNDNKKWIKKYKWDASYQFFVVGKSHDIISGIRSKMLFIKTCCGRYKWRWLPIFC